MRVAVRDRVAMLVLEPYWRALEHQPPHRRRAVARSLVCAARHLRVSVPLAGQVTGGTRARVLHPDRATTDLPTSSR